MAACGNVQTYAAAQTFYWVGYDGIAYVLDVFIADTSSLQWRALMFGFTTSPYIATTFAGPAAAARYYNTSGWRWAYGTFAIITPLICLPFLTVFWYNQRQAKKRGILIKTPESTQRTSLQSVRHYLIEFDGKLTALSERVHSACSYGVFSQLSESSSFVQDGLFSFYHSTLQHHPPKNGVLVTSSRCSLLVSSSS